MKITTLLLATCFTLALGSSTPSFAEDVKPTGEKSAVEQTEKKTLEEKPATPKDVKKS
jgi:hypothetical protein